MTKTSKHVTCNICFTALVEELLKTPGVRLTGSGWSSWEMWSACTQECAKGYRTRKRTCTSAEGKSVPTACRGSPVEYQDCNPQPCPGNTHTHPLRNMHVNTSTLQMHIYICAHKYTLKQTPTYAHNQGSCSSCWKSLCFHQGV